MKPNWKPSATLRKIAKVKRRRDTKKAEDANKKEVRARDLYRCRFPLCGCRTLGLKLEARREVSHQQHKGAGGNPTGDRSSPDLMILLCKHRHQDGAVSIHKGTLKARPLTREGTDGPVAWDVDMVAYRRAQGHVAAGERWMEVAREVAVQKLEGLSATAIVILQRLSEMDI